MGRNCKANKVEKGFEEKIDPGHKKELTFHGEEESWWPVDCHVGRGVFYESERKVGRGQGRPELKGDTSTQEGGGWFRGGIFLEKGGGGKDHIFQKRRAQK